MCCLSRNLSYCPAGRSAVWLVRVDADVPSSEVAGGNSRRARTKEGVENSVFFVSEKLYEPLRQPVRKHGAVIAIPALSRSVKDVRRVRQVPSDPLRHVFPESAEHPGFVTPSIGRAQVAQASFPPVSHRHHDCFLPHLELAGLVELEEPFP